MHLLRVAPVIGRAGVGRIAAANERAVFDAGDVLGVAASKKRIGVFGWIEPDKSAGRNQQLVDPCALGLGPVAPHDRGRLRQPRDFVNPRFKRWMRQPNHNADLSRAGCHEI
jgi:hypothetical protein